MADYGVLTYCRVIGRYNGIIGDTTGQFGDPGATPDIYNVNMPATLKVWAAGTSRDEVPELRITDAVPPRTLLLTPVDARVESGILRLPAAEVDGVDVVAKSAVMGLGETPLLLTVAFGTATINGRDFTFDAVTVELPVIEPADYTAGVVQKIVLTGGGDGGNWALVYGNAPTGFLSPTATALQLQTQLRAIAAIGNNVDVTGPVSTPDGPEYTATFTGPVAAAHPLIFGKIDNLTGGSLPSVRITDTYQPVVIDLTTADRVLDPPSTPPAELVIRRIPTEYVIGGTGDITFLDQNGDPMGPAFTPGPGSGNMLAEVYDPTSKSADAFARANHSGQQASSTISDFTEASQDAVAAMLAQGTGITLTYNDAANSLTIAATGGGGTIDAEAIRDAIGIALIGAGLINVAVNDAADTITISTTATANATDAALRDRATHTGTQSADSIVDGTANKAYTAVDKTKLGGIATGATANASDAALRDRSLHTGQQTSSTISDFAEAAQDALAAALTQGTGITLTYDDAANTLTVTGTAGDPETIRDVIGVAMIGSGLINVTVDDGGNTITISTTATANDTDANLKNRANHSGSQLAATISDFATAADARVSALAILKSIVDAKGDLIVGTAADTVTRLAAGTTGDVLTRDPSTATGLKWAAPTGGGGGGGPAAVVQLLGNGTDTSLPIAHAFNSRHVRLTIYRNAAPWDTLEPVRYERTDLDTITVLPDEVWPANFAVGLVEFIAQSDNVAPDPGVAAFSSATASSLTYTFTGQTDNVAVDRIEARDGTTDAVLNTDVTSPWVRTGLAGSTAYGTYFRVYDAEGNFADTNIVTHTTDAPAGDTTPPTAGVLSFASKTSTSITYTFTAGSDDVAVTQIDAYDAATNTLIDDIVTSPWTRTGLTALTAYDTKMRYRDAAGHATDSNTVSQTTPSSAGPVTPMASSAGNRVTTGTAVTDTLTTTAGDGIKILGVAFVALSHSNHNPTPDTYDTIELLDSAGGNWTFVKGFTGGQFTGTQLGTILMFKKTSLGASLTHNLTCNVIKSGYTWTSMQIDAECYDNGEDLGTAVTANGTTGAMSLSITTATGEYAVAGFCASGAIAGGSFASGANVRYNNGGSVTGTGDYMGVLDKAGPGTPTVLNSTGSQAWGAVGAPVQKVA